MKIMKKKIVPRLLPMTALLLTLAFVATSWAIVSPPSEPDLTVCENVTCETLEDSVCSGGFRITLTNYKPAATSNSNTATYTYEICYGQIDCPIEDAIFSNPIHFEVTFPKLGCQAGEIEVTTTCACNTEDTESCDIIHEVDPGDFSCLSTDSDYLVAKCEKIYLSPPYCIIMTVSVAGTGLGLGAAVLADVDTCITSCLAAPSCTPCEEGGPECLVRTIGFWGTHPHIAAEYDPVTVCGVELNGQDAGTCSTSEALCTNANDYKQNPPYLSFVAQLTAAKLNLNATKQLLDGSCNTWEYQGKSIKDWIDYCEPTYCSASKQAIGQSGCIEALTAFNESQDTGFDVTPEPFDQPGPANPSQCQAARGNGINIGNCAEEAPPADHQKGKK